MAQTERVQLHLSLSFKHDPTHDPRVRGYLEDGYRIEDLQRLSDRDALVTLARAGGGAEGG